MLRFKMEEGVSPHDRIPSDKQAHIARIVGDGVNWHAYEHGDEIPDAHTEEAFAAPRKSKKK